MKKIFSNFALFCYKLFSKTLNPFYCFFQFFAFKTSKNPLMKKINSIPYIVCIKFFAFLAKSSEIKAIFLRGRVSRGEIFPGDSDLDFFIISKELSIEEEFGLVEKISKRIALLKLFFPFVGSFLLLNEKEAEDSEFLRIYFELKSKGVSKLKQLNGIFSFPQFGLADLPLGLEISNHFENSFLKLFFSHDLRNKVYSRTFCKHSMDLIELFSVKSQKFGQKFDEFKELIEYRDLLIEKSKKSDFIGDSSLLFEQFFFMLKIQEMFFREKLVEKNVSIKKTEEDAKIRADFLQKFAEFDSVKNCFESVFFSKKPFGFSGEIAFFVLRDNLQKTKMLSALKLVKFWKNSFKETEFRIETFSSFFGKAYCCDGTNCLLSSYLRKNAKIVFGKNLPQCIALDEKILHEKAKFELKFLCNVSSKTILLKTFGLNQNLTESSKLLQAKALQIYLKNGKVLSEKNDLEKAFSKDVVTALNSKKPSIGDCEIVFVELLKLSV